MHFMTRQSWTCQARHEEDRQRLNASGAMPILFCFKAVLINISLHGAHTSNNSSRRNAAWEGKRFDIACEGQRCIATLLLMLRGIERDENDRLLDPKLLSPCAPHKADVKNAFLQ
jgi:hypothetical protein